MSSPSARFAPERHEFVMAELARAGRVEAAALAVDLDVSTETVRKDLVALEDLGLLQRVHGGAVRARSLTFEPVVEQRTGRAREKQLIAARALELVEPTTSLLLDAGSTTAALAVLLPTSHAGPVWTGSLPIALSLIDRGIDDVRVLGGSIRRQTRTGVGRAALDVLETINVDVAFLGTNGVSPDRGLTTPDESEALVKHRMLATARRRVLLVDSSKFGQQSLCRHARLSDLDTVVTDSDIQTADADLVTSSGVELLVAGATS